MTKHVLSLDLDGKQITRLKQGDVIAFKTTSKVVVVIRENKSLFIDGNTELGLSSEIDFWSLVDMVCAVTGLSHGKFDKKDNWVLTVLT